MSVPGSTRSSSRNSAGNLAAKQNSKEILARLWRGGVGRESPGRPSGTTWTVGEFRKRVETIKNRLKDTALTIESAPSDETIQNWLDGVTLTQSRHQPAVLRVFFGHPPCDCDDRNALERVWANDETVAAAVPASPAAQTPPVHWVPDEPNHLRPDFARMYLAPQYTGSRLAHVPVVVSVSLSEIYIKLKATDDSPPLSVTVRPAAVQVLPEEQNMQPATGTVLGRDQIQEGVAYAGGVWTLQNPRELNDNPLAGVALCDMLPVRDGPYGLKLTLRCKDLDLEVKPINPPPEVSEMQLAVLRRVLQRMDCDPDAEYVDLATCGFRSRDAG